MTTLRRVEVGERSHHLFVTAADGIVVDEIFVENVYRVSPSDVADKVVIDAGGHIGCFAVWAYLAGARRIITVEADPIKLGQLHSNVDPIPEIIVVERAITEDPEPTLRQWTPSSQTGTGGAHLDENGTDAVVTINLDELLELAGHDVGFLKMDIEGGEYALDFTPARLSQIERLAMEFHGTSTDSTDHTPRWERLVGQLAVAGSVTTLGHPARGGSLFWTRN